MVLKRHANSELKADPRAQVLHLWEGETKPFSFGNSANQTAQKIEQLKTLQSQSVAQFQKHFDMLLGEGRSFELKDVNLLPLKDYFSNQKCEELFVVSFKMGAEAVRGYFILPRNFFFFLYGFLFGGKRFFSKNKLSLLEKNYFQRLLQSFFEIAAQSWSSMGSYKIESEEQFFEAEEISKILSENEYVLTPFEMKEGETLYNFSFLYPKELLSLFEQNPEKNEQGQAEQKDEKWEQAVVGALSDGPSVEIQVELGRLEMSLSEALKIQEGQVFPLVLDAAGHGIEVNHKSAFVGKMGALGDSRAIQIIDTL